MYINRDHVQKIQLSRTNQVASSTRVNRNGPERYIALIYFKGDAVGSEFSFSEEQARDDFVGKIVDDNSSKFVWVER